MDKRLEDEKIELTDDVMDQSVEKASHQYRTQFSSSSNSTSTNSIFLLDESTFHPAMPKISHWSIAWSDLMMTMFVLFLSMFIYQAAHKDFLVTDEVEVLGGETNEALEITDDSRAGFPFVPLKPGAPLITSGTVKKVEPITLLDIDKETVFFDGKNRHSLDRIRKSVLPPLSPLDEAKKPDYQTPAKKESLFPQATEDPLEEKKDAEVVSTPPVKEETIPKVAITPAELPTKNDIISEIFTINKENLDYYNLGKFADIKLIPDKTVRIILTGDLLFPTGSSELTPNAIISLHKMALAIEKTPYIINVVGHTDNIPMKSSKYSSNWELSLSRASSVARFLIDVIGMSPNQFVVSGYASYRAVVPNTNAKNRSQNRRVEIIISKKLPKPLAINQEKIQ